MGSYVVSVALYKFFVTLCNVFALRFIWLLGEFLSYRLWSLVVSQFLSFWVVFHMVSCQIIHWFLWSLFVCLLYLIFFTHLKRVFIGLCSLRLCIGILHFSFFSFVWLFAQLPLTTFSAPWFSFCINKRDEEEDEEGELDDRAAKGDEGRLPFADDSRGRALLFTCVLDLETIRRLINDRMMNSVWL